MSHTTMDEADNIESGGMTREWLRCLPKAELHLHLEGTVQPATLVELSRRYDAEPMTLEGAARLYEYTNFVGFLRAFRKVCSYLRAPKDYAIVTYDMLTSLAAQGVKHAEVFISLGNILHWNPELWESVDSVIEAIEQARERAQQEYGISMFWIVDGTRNFGAAEVGSVFRKAADVRRRYPSFIGVGIGGDECLGPCEMFRHVYSEAKLAGLRLVAHAGESTGPGRGPKEIRDAISIGAERIGHGIAAQHDEELMRELEQMRMPLECSLTSNIKTGCCKTLSDHPLMKFIHAGLLVTINSDDPGMFGSDLLAEYVLIQRIYSLDKSAIKSLAANSFVASFLPDSKKNVYLSLIKDFDGSEPSERTGW